MKKHIITVIAITACVALCAAMWLRNAEAEDLPAEPIKPAVVAEIKARLEKTPEILLSADTHTLEPETVAEYEPERADITTEKETPIPALAQETKVQEVSPTSAELRMGDVRIINGESKYISMASVGLKTRAAVHREQRSVTQAMSSQVIRSARWVAA